MTRLPTATSTPPAPHHSSAVEILAGDVRLPGDLTLPKHARGIVLFAHGSGSSRLSPRNIYVARVLLDAGIGTLLFDLLTPAEDRVYQTRFDVSLLASRLLTANNWVSREPAASALPIGYFGASTGAAAAIVAAAELGNRVAVIVSRGGRPDLASNDCLQRVRAPTLFIVGGEDLDVIALNRKAYACLTCEKALLVVPGATHLFEEPGTLEQVAAAAAAWFQRWLIRAPAAAQS